VRSLGIVTALALAVVAVVAIAVGLRSAPDAKRYLKMRRM
jgi:hypothetical protein